MFIIISKNVRQRKETKLDSDRVTHAEKEKQLKILLIKDFTYLYRLFCNNLKKNKPVDVTIICQNEIR